MKKRARFLSFEGIEGCGKTTQIARLSEYLAARSISCTVTREPGATAVGEGIRRILLNSGTIGLTREAELLLFFASRSQNISENLGPAIARGDVVICDRFFDASMAYQGYGRGIPLEFIEKLTDLVCGAMRPELTVLLDIDPEVGLRRARERNRKSEGGAADEGRFEMEDVVFYTKIRNGYLEMASQAPERFRVIDANRSIEAVHLDIVSAIGL